MVDISRKELIIDALCGVGFGSLQFADQMEKSGLAKYTGNQWNTNWEWNRIVLGGMTEEELEKLYKEAKNVRR